MTSISDNERQYVFNIVWTGGVFERLRYFVCSQMAQSGARFRFVINGCTPESVEQMEKFAELHADRIVEIFHARPVMAAHGLCLDEVLEQRDDGEFFCLIDPDIKASGPFLREFTELLATYDGVGSGRAVWCETDVVPDGHPGLPGECFFRSDGFVYGSPHFSMYRRAALVETIERWGVSFKTAGPDIPAVTRAVLVAGGHPYRIFDTGKVLNIMLQHDHTLTHFEHPQLMHIGGMSHYLEPGAYIERGGEQLPDWVRFDSMASRFEVARFTADMLLAGIDERDLPPIPAGLDPSLEERLVRVRDAIVDLVETYRTW